MHASKIRAGAQILRNSDYSTALQAELANPVESRAGPCK